MSGTLNVIDVRLESLATPCAALPGDAVVFPAPPANAAVPGEGKSFYLETFGCQMNDHDSEKVAGVLLGADIVRWKRRTRRDVVLLQHLQHSRKSGATKFFRGWDFIR